MLRRSIRALSLSLVLLSGNGCSRADKHLEQDAFPLLTVYLQSGGYPGPGQVASPSGLLFAVCKNGHVFRLANQAKIDGSFLEGSLAADALAGIKEQFSGKRISSLKSECATHTLHSDNWRMEFADGQDHEFIDCEVPSQGPEMTSLSRLVWGGEIYSAKSHQGAVDIPRPCR